MGPQERSRRERARSHSRVRPGGLRQGQQLSSTHPTEATAPDAGAVASLMSRHHGYLEFIGGSHLSESLTSAFADSVEWCRKLTEQNLRLYAVPAPPQVAAAFVLQHLLSIPAQACAFAAATGPWRVEVGTLEEPMLSVELAPGLYPERIGFLALEPADADLETRVAQAHTAYLQLGREIADAYDADVKMSSRQRLGMVDDLWAMALREARAATGGGWGPTVERQSCCLIYALPDCHECAGCPRLATPT